VRRGPLLGVCAFAALTAGVGSCSSSANSSVTTSGTQLTIYAAAPAGTPASPDILHAERLAFQQFQQETGGKVGKFTVHLATADASKISDNARTAIEDSSAIAYIGELTPGASEDSVGITNSQDLLQVSPADTALELTRPTAAVPGAPKDYYESEGTYGYTFARVVPNSAQEARAQIGEMSTLGVRKLYVTDDGSAYGEAIALAVKQNAGNTISVVQGPPDASKFQASGADALFFGASSESASAVGRLFGNVAQANAGVKLFAPSALDTTAFASSFGGAKLNLYVSAPGFLPKGLTPSGRQFTTAFSAAYGHAPALGAIFGFEAMDAVLAVLREAGTSANNRSAVVNDFFKIKDRQSVLGTYSINSAGDISLAPFVFSRLRNGTLVPFAAVPSDQ
jgi:branched-chain amino acid transport system substrate-binding protein